MMMIFFNIINHILIPRGISLTGEIGDYPYVTKLTEIHNRGNYSVKCGAVVFVVNTVNFAYYNALREYAAARSYYIIPRCNT